MRDVHERGIGVIGAGSWGTALANVLAGKGYPVDLWVFEPEIKEQIARERENRTFLPGVKLSGQIMPTNVIHQAVAEKHLVLVVVPSHVMRAVAGSMADALLPETIIVSAAKGIETETGMLMSEVLLDSIPSLSEERIAVLSGPSFASEVARQVPTLITVAAKNPKVALLVQEILATPYFRVYTHDDVVGVQLGGSMKNYIAIAAGMIDGMGIGLNLRAALITRGLAEIRRLGLQLGANPHTFSGLSGLGDLVLTCTGHLSRNYTVGKQIGQGKRLDEILSGMKMVAEGVRTAQSVYQLSHKLGVEMPICESVYQILFEQADPQDTLGSLMTRELKAEWKPGYDFQPLKTVAFFAAKKFFVKT